MEVDEDDDFYGEGAVDTSVQEQGGEQPQEASVNVEQDDDGLEEGEEEDEEGSDSV